MNAKLIAAALIFTAIASTASAATYYLDINGVGEDGILGTPDDVISSDANPGTSA